MRTSCMISERLAIQAAAGDHEALADLFERHYPGTYRYVHRRVRSVQAAEDLAAEVWVRVSRGIHRYTSNGEGYFTRWLCTIAKNVIRSAYRAGQRRPDLAPEMLLLSRPADGDGPEEIAMRQEVAREVARALGALTTQQRECLMLRYWDGMTEAETAAVMNMTVGAVKQLQFRGKRTMRRVLGPDYATMTPFPTTTVQTDPADVREKEDL